MTVFYPSKPYYDFYYTISMLPLIPLRKMKLIEVKPTWDFRSTGRIGRIRPKRSHEPHLVRSPLLLFFSFLLSLSFLLYLFFFTREPRSGCCCFSSLLWERRDKILIGFSSPRFSLSLSLFNPRFGKSS